MQHKAPQELHWRRYTHEPVGFVSAAEGVVFLSGLVAGLVYSRVLQEQGPASTAGRASGPIRTLPIPREHCMLGDVFAVMWLGRLSR
ncbi:MAG: OpgC domain-containing protein [Anaerolineae bacterium]